MRRLALLGCFLVAASGDAFQCPKDRAGLLAARESMATVFVTLGSSRDDVKACLKAIPADDAAARACFSPLLEYADFIEGKERGIRFDPKFFQEKKDRLLVPPLLDTPEFLELVRSGDQAKLKAYMAKLKAEKKADLDYAVFDSSIPLNEASKGKDTRLLAIRLSMPNGDERWFNYSYDTQRTQADSIRVAMWTRIKEGNKSYSLPYEAYYLPGAKELFYPKDEASLAGLGKCYYCHVNGGPLTLRSEKDPGEHAAAMARMNQSIRGASPVAMPPFPAALASPPPKDGFPDVRRFPMDAEALGDDPCGIVSKFRKRFGDPGLTNRELMQKALSCQKCHDGATLPRLPVEMNAIAEHYIDRFHSMPPGIKEKMPGRDERWLLAMFVSTQTYQRMLLCYLTNEAKCAPPPSGPTKGSTAEPVPAKDGTSKTDRDH